MKRLACLLLAVAAASLAADDPAPASFAWRGTLDTGGRTGLMRIAVPGEALARLQSRDAADLRIADAQGRAVPFAQSAPALPAAAPRQQAGTFPALPLYSADTGVAQRPGAVEVRVDRNGERQSLWVQLGAPSGEPPPAPQRQAAALFDTRAQQEPVSGLLVRARVPPNAPVRFTVSTSADLAQWTQVPVQGRVFRFDGAGAPANDVLELASPLQLKDRFLRLDWSGQAEVAVDAVVPLLPHRQPHPQFPTVSLREPFADGTTALEWQTGFATPLRKLHLATGQANTLVPLRILGRNQPSEPWRLLAHTVAYRLGEGSDTSSNGPVELAHPSVRWLRVEATHGARLQGLGLTAQALFDPLELVFVAGAAGPYQLLSGREATTATALPLELIGSVTKARVQDLPAARVARVDSDAAATYPWTRWLPRGVDGKTAGLWLVLALGVLLLGGVAWSLMRQVNAKARQPGA